MKNKQERSSKEVIKEGGDQQLQCQGEETVIKGSREKWLLAKVFPEVLGFLQDSADLEQRLKDLPRHVLKIDQKQKEQVVAGKDLLNLFCCTMCHCIPRMPIVECKTCSSFFCKECVDNEQKNLEGFVICKKCCAKDMFKPMNRKSRQIFFSQIKFKHSCPINCRDTIEQIREQ